MELLVAIIVGIATGVTSSVLVWFALTHLFQPDVELSRNLVSYTGIDGTPRCQIKYLNQRKRPVYSLSLTLRVGVRGLTTAGTTEWMRLKDFARPVVDGGAGYRTSLYIDQIEGLQRLSYLLPKDLRDALDSEGRVPLTALFENGVDAVLVAHIGSVDSYSRAMSVETREYSAADVIRGRFIEDSLDIDRTALVATLDNTYSEEDE